MAFEGKEEHKTYFVREEPQQLITLLEYNFSKYDMYICCKHIVPRCS